MNDFMPRTIVMRVGCIVPPKPDLPAIVEAFGETPKPTYIEYEPLKPTGGQAAQYFTPDRRPGDPGYVGPVVDRRS